MAKSNGLHNSPANQHPCPPAQARVEGDTEGTGPSTRRSGWSLVCLTEAAVGQGRGGEGQLSVSAKTWCGQGCNAKPQLPASSGSSGCGQVP